MCRWQIMSRTMGKSGNGIPRNWGWRVGAKVPVERGGQRRVSRRHLGVPGAVFCAMCEELLHAHTCVLRPRAQACGPLPWSFTCQRSVKCVYACVRVQEGQSGAKWRPPLWDGMRTLVARAVGGGSRRRALLSSAPAGWTHVFCASDASSVGGWLPTITYPTIRLEGSRAASPHSRHPPNTTDSIAVRECERGGTCSPQTGSQPHIANNM